MKKQFLYLFIDLCVAAVIVLMVWIVNYKIPKSGTQASDEENLMAGDWSGKFADYFTDKIVETDQSYTSPDVSVQITYHSYDSGKVDKSEFGKHLGYGSKISYVLADIHIANLNCLSTGFAQNMYGVGYTEKLSQMVQSRNSILAINGDSYSNNRNRANGTIIRNGKVYRIAPTDMETCVLNKDGTMQIYEPENADAEQMIANGAWQSWIFGPSLLDENGHAKKQFRTWDYIRESHPRTAIGYYEPGHYCMLLVDGRQSDTRGMFLDEMAALFEKLGCKVAYNLDGGHCSFMDFNGQIINHPYKPEHEVADGIFITELKHE